MSAVSWSAMFAREHSITRFDVDNAVRSDVRCSNAFQVRRILTFLYSHSPGAWVLSAAAACHQSPRNNVHSETAGCICTYWRVRRSYQSTKSTSVAAGRGMLGLQIDEGYVVRGWRSWFTAQRHRNEPLNLVYIHATTSILHNYSAIEMSGRLQ